MLQTVEGTLENNPKGFSLSSSKGGIRIDTAECRLFLLLKENAQHFVLPVGGRQRVWRGSDLLWILPEAIASNEKAICLRATGAAITIRLKSKRYEIHIACGYCEAEYYDNRPRCDFFCAPYEFGIPGGDKFARTLAAFYWDSMLPMVTEKTAARCSRFSKGFVLSTLQKGAYPGTYPDVDHEFQIKGRLAFGDALDTDIVRRMMELQIDVMRRDPSGKWRNPCAIQPGGRREYHVPRRSKNLKQRAVMFLLTGNIELIESAWLYCCRTKDMEWMREHIGDLENTIGLVAAHIDEGFRLWSDVYYEDQVIKDGRETIAQAFAVHSFLLLSELESLLGRDEQAQKYARISQGLADTLVKPLPEGYWDDANHRFIDWVDRKGGVHDHIHLLANELPLLFGCADAAQRMHVERLLEEHKEVLWKFPSFVAAKIEEYSDDEIGTGGPYDLSAAGRYWCWDAAYWQDRRNCALLRAQLETVAAQAEADGFIMGERYDMNYIYYPSDKMWHGAAYYYEYPNVFAWVLLHEYLGIHSQPDCDYLISPRVDGEGSVRFAALRYTVGAGQFLITNEGGRVMTVRVDLSAIYPDAKQLRTEQGNALAAGERLGVQPGETVKLDVIR